ncbi:uncharacterized protein BROUX77_001617 [Berkeleyomyces rouxiae]|uniref:uncharacterized protein n=1 Tax=Berkeleyomyces rouxiae TaxID=2035830 RepID=UPI003B7F9F79
MPNPIAISAGLIAATVAVAAIVIICESPEVRRYAEGVHRRFAQSMSGRRGVNSTASSDDEDEEFCEPLYNRPEDADGFAMSSQARHRLGLSEDVREDIDMDTLDNNDDVTEEARLRQREELEYWNAIHESQEMENARRAAASADAQESMNELVSRIEETFKPDAEDVTSAFNSGANVNSDGTGLRRRGENQSQYQSRGLGSSFYTAPLSSSGFAAPQPAAAIAASAFEDIPDIYSATNTEDDATRTEEIKPKVSDVAIVSNKTVLDDNDTASSVTLDRAMTPTSETTPMNPFSDINEVQSQNDAFASIQAWAEQSNESFYSPMPLSPNAVSATAARSTGQSVISLNENDSDDEAGEGVMTPTGSSDGSAVHVGNGNDTVSNADSRDDVISQTDGMLTPASWSEIGSVVSDDDMHVPA